MTNNLNKLLVSIMIVCSTCVLLNAHAEQAPVPATAPDQLPVQLPAIDHASLVEQVEALRSRLIRRRQALEEVVAENKLDGADAVIMAILPGGLLYTGYKKARCEKAKNALARVNAAIAEYASDLLALQSWSAPVALARLH
jgi:hypothetical protein